MDAQTALQYVYRRADLRSDAVFVFGRSLGGAVAIWLAATFAGLVRTTPAAGGGARAGRGGAGSMDHPAQCARPVLRHGVLPSFLRKHERERCCARDPGGRRVESSGACTSTGLSSPALWQVRGLIVENSFTGIEDMARELLPPLRVLPHWVLRPLVWSRWPAPGPSKKRNEKKSAWPVHPRDWRTA